MWLVLLPPAHPKLPEEMPLVRWWLQEETTDVSYRVSFLLSIRLHIERKNSGMCRHRNLSIEKKTQVST